MQLISFSLNENEWKKNKSSKYMYTLLFCNERVLSKKAIVRGGKMLISKNRRKIEFNLRAHNYTKTQSESQNKNMM